VTIECYYSTCPNHGTHEGEEDPLCFEQECTASAAEIKMYESGRKLQLRGYSLDELEVDNPYNTFGENV
jgi:hypothetical protein